jgi:hypothetical protein
VHFLAVFTKKRFQINHLKIRQVAKASEVVQPCCKRLLPPLPPENARKGQLPLPAHSQFFGALLSGWPRAGSRKIIRSASHSELQPRTERDFGPRHGYARAPASQNARRQPRVAFVPEKPDRTCCRNGDDSEQSADPKKPDSRA